jgi:hypothetical protein
VARADRQALTHLLKDFFELLVCSFIAYARRLSEVILQIGSAIEGLQVPVEPRIVFLALH